MGEWFGELDLLHSVLDFKELTYKIGTAALGCCLSSIISVGVKCLGVPVVVIDNKRDKSPPENAIEMSIIQEQCIYCSGDPLRHLKLWEEMC